MPTKEKDIFFIQALKIETVIGIYNWEKKVKQTVVFDLEFPSAIKKAAKTGNIVDTIDYAKLTARVTEFVGSNKFGLIEELAEQVASLLIKEFKLKRLKLRVNKLGAIINAEGVGVIIER